MEAELSEAEFISTAVSCSRASGSVVSQRCVAESIGSADTITELAQLLQTYSSPPCSCLSVGKPLHPLTG